MSEALEEGEVVEVPITATSLLAAILNQIDSVKLTVEQLTADYSEYQMAVEVSEDDQEYAFSLIRGDDVES